MRLRKSTGITNGRRPEVRSLFPSLRFTRDRSPKDERERERERERENRDVSNDDKGRVYRSFGATKRLERATRRDQRKYKRITNNHNNNRLSKIFAKARAPSMSLSLFFRMI